MVMYKCLVFIGMFVVLGCAAARDYGSKRILLPEDAVLYISDASVVFDRMISALEKNGYEIEIIDRAAGYIQTRPKDIDIQGNAALHYKGFYVIRVGPRRDGAFAVIRFAVVPELPKERDKLMLLLEQEGLR